MRVGFEGPVVNGAPVERQSRPRPSPQTRPNPTRSASVPPVREAFFAGGIRRAGGEWRSCGAPEPAPTEYADETESHPLRHKRTLILIQRLAFFLSRRPFPIWLFALCWVQTPLALLSRVGARGVFLCVFQFSWVLRLLAGCKIKRQTCFRFIANLTIVSSINLQNQAHCKSNKLQLTNPGCALVISRQHSSMQAPLCLESDFLHG